MIAPLLILINESKFVLGLCMLLINIGSKYIVTDMDKIHVTILSTRVAKFIILFALFFVATRDFLHALALLAFYLVFVDVLLRYAPTILPTTRPTGQPTTQ